ncbi:MAG: preprotein translocase subunit SecA [Patescibacteria group bacterium]|nr:preprotein translocase subunit SecA [Patescibacteria group bacterium]
MSLLTKVFGDPNERVIKSLLPLVEEINNLEKEVAGLSPEQLKDASLELRAKLEHGATLDDILPRAFAICREAAKRTLGQRHYDVQLMGGIVLHRGQIAEMRTGEGKTLTATLAVYLNALTGKGVHLVTVNDYLARRDAAWMGQVYDALGLSVACINHDSAFRYDAAWMAPKQEKELTDEDLAAAAAKDEGGALDKKRDETGAFLVQMDYMRPVARQEAYAADITYGTNNEYGFDYLRDNMVMRPEQRVQRPLNYAIVDEVDSILIDEARTPLIISAPAEEAAETYYKFADLVRPLKEGVHFNKDEKMNAVTFSEEGQEEMAQRLGADPWAAGDTKFAYHLEAALKAQELYKKDVNYIVKDGEVIIVDEFTGRLMHGRRFSEGLHQAIEAKEGVAIQRESQTLATVTFQNLFRMYPKLAGMTGTAATEAEEFSKIYKLDVTVVPPNKPSRRDDLPDRVYKSEEAKYKAVVEEIKARHASGQPVLVGTISIEKNEILGELLKREGVPHELLNAKNHEREATIIAQAGRRGAVTIATNMAGRGVDIILGGNPPDKEETQRIRELGGLMIIGTERHESRRIDNQLRGRAGRQGDPGTTQFFLSMGDDLIRIFAGEDNQRRMQGLMEKLGLPDDMPIEANMVTKSIASAQNKVEGHHFDIRKHLLEYDDVLNKHRETIYRRRRDVIERTGPDAPAEIRERVLAVVEDELERLVLFHTAGEDEKAWNLKEIIETVGTMYPLSSELPTELENLRREAGSRAADAAARTAIIEYLVAQSAAAYERLETALDQHLAQYPGQGRFCDVVRSLMLRAIDMFWVEHLDAMEHLRTGIGLQSYGQRDPLIEYKREAFRMFGELTQLIDKQIAYSVFKIGIAPAPAKEKSLIERQGLQVSGAAKGGESSSSLRAPGEDKVGRNDPCPCGSGKKYKKCCGA